MFQTRTTKLVIGILLMSFLLSGCLNTAPAEPTPDAQAIFNSAVQTIQAGLTQSALLTPSATATLEPTVTFTVTVPPLQPIGQGTADPNQPSATALFTLPPLSPLATATLPAVASGDKAEWVANQPPDGATVLTGAKFDVVWTVRNSGTTTWNTKYKLVYFSGAKFHEKSSYGFREEVKPGNTTNLVIDAIAPSNPGDYETWWKLQNDQGQNFGDVTLLIKVVRPGPTNTPDLTATAEFCLDNPLDDDCIDD